MGWALGSNDASNVFGTAVASRIIRYRTAVILAAIFILIGALLEGFKGIRGVSEVASQTLRSAFIITVAAGLTVTVMTRLRLPVSATQAVMGAKITMALCRLTVIIGSRSMPELGVYEPGSTAAVY